MAENAALRLQLRFLFGLCFPAAVRNHRPTALFDFVRYVYAWALVECVGSTTIATTSQILLNQQGGRRACCVPTTGHFAPCPPHRHRVGSVVLGSQPRAGSVVVMTPLFSKEAT